MDTQQCRVCNGPLARFFASELPFSVNSAAIPVKKAARVFRCRSCQLLQKVDADMVCDYSERYVVFQNNPQFDKIVRTPGRAPRTRSQVLAEWVSNRLENVAAPRLLEIGCHRGAFLRAVRERNRNIELHGHDVDGCYAAQVESLCGPGRFHHQLDDVPGKFDACVLIHTFEHVPRPLHLLAEIRKRLLPSGFVLIVVPDCDENTADLYTIDHTAHYRRPQLAQVLRAGYFSPVSALKLIANELVMVGELANTMLSAETFNLSAAIVNELQGFEQSLLHLPPGPYFVFGTALVGMLIASLLGDECLGFIDDNKEQLGGSVLGRAVLAPEEASGQKVILGVGRKVAEVVAPRLESLGCTVLNPWIAATDAARIERDLAAAT